MTGKTIQSFPKWIRRNFPCLQNLADQGLGKNPSELMPFIMGAASQEKNAGLNFSSDEISAIIEVLKIGKSPTEIARLDRIVNLMKMIRH